MKKACVVIVVLGMFVAGCATQRYGRMTKAVKSETRGMSCQQLQAEIDKCNQFIREVTDQNKKFTGRDVLSFLGDFGIGDSWEVSDAIKSANNRIVSLQAVREEKCKETSTSEKSKEG